MPIRPALKSSTAGSKPPPKSELRRRGDRPAPGFGRGGEPLVVRDDASKPIRESFSGGEVNCVERAELPRRDFSGPHENFDR